MKNIFDIAVVNELIARIQQLQANTQPIWGKMSVAQMLAHCNVTYEMAFENKHARRKRRQRGRRLTNPRKVLN